MILEQIGQQAREASRFLALAGDAEKREMLEKLARELEADPAPVLEANEKDLTAGVEAGMSPALQDRLRLTPERIAGMVEGIRSIAGLPDPVGQLLEEIRRPNGLVIRKVSVPLGVIGVIYEARPNVTTDAAALCIRSGNAVILRGGREAYHTNAALVERMRTVLDQLGVPRDCIQLVQDTSRHSAQEMMHLDQYLDLLIPRGGAGLIRTVVENATVPVIQTGVGNCHIYVDRDADLDMAASLVYNAKTSRPSVCNAAESLLLHRDVAEAALAKIKAELDKKQVTLHGDPAACALDPSILPAAEEDWGREYLDYQMSVKVVCSWQEAVRHILRYGTGHSECIVTENRETAERFLDQVDAAAVYVNASTRFTDGGEFGFGAEIGISTQKLHVRGPVGLPALTSYKYKIYGNGQIR